MTALRNFRNSGKSIQQKASNGSLYKSRLTFSNGSLNHSIQGCFFKCPFKFSIKYIFHLYTGLIDVELEKRTEFIKLKKVDPMFLPKHSKKCVKKEDKIKKDGSKQSLKSIRRID